MPDLLPSSISIPWLVCGAVAVAFLLRLWAHADRVLHRRWQAMRGRMVMDLPRHETAPATADVAELQEIVAGLVQEDRWHKLGQVLALLSNTPTDATDGRRLYDVAMDAALQPLVEAQGLSGMAAVLRRIAEAAGTGEPALVALHCRALACALCRAETLDDTAGAAMAGGWASEILESVAEHDLDTCAVPCLAEAIYHAGAVLQPEPQALQRAFRVWRDADPGNIRPYVHHAARLAALGADARTESARHLTETVGACRLFGSSAALLHAQLASAGAAPLSGLPSFCPTSTLARLGEVAEAPGGQTLVNAFAAKALADGDEALARAILRKHMRMVLDCFWPDMDAFHGLFWRAFRGRGSGRARAEWRAEMDATAAA
ncbi:hypothetical protein [Roseisalinus antarcticus]|uniref:Uncharacterized protein n=1 Tax=Roseisalinus antarcticus TaxID=254357 RepID=A0A1Y5RCU9_9RHOB|nr:hypothetical protein [Roseisalinus antarcticus]SLN13620.1 hypothetical protein ROA7023_00063 [Roseisalinus antarcticus]